MSCSCSKPVKRAELLARIKAHLRVKSDATWVQSIVKGVLTEDSEAMKILESILPESIISRIQVSYPLASVSCSDFHGTHLSSTIDMPRSMASCNVQVMLGSCSAAVQDRAPESQLYAAVSQYCLPG